MQIPDQINARWLATLKDEQLLSVESKLHTVFYRHEVVEKKRSGGRYILLQGPGALVDAWHRWSIVSNETRQRGLIIRRRAARSA